MGGRRKALIIANGAYDHEGLRHLASPAADAAALADVLGDRAIGGFDVDVVHDQPAHVVEAHIEDLFSGNRLDDLILLHFSCHGLKSDSGELFFAMKNTRPDRLASTAVPADFVQRQIRHSRASSVVLLLDCCYGGAYAGGVAVRSAGSVNVQDSFPAQPLGSGRGRAVITASNAIEYAFEGDQLADGGALQPSVFTSALVRGLKTGEADRDEDGRVSLNELYDYLFDQVRARNPNQTPSRDIEMQGELYLAHSQRRRIVAAPIPPDLLAATTDANMFSRIGAIGELRARLLSADLPVAAGAHQVLAEMSRTDIGPVAEKATEADREAAVHTDVDAVRFGQLESGSESPHLTVRLQGPSIARACVPQVFGDWIQVTMNGDVADVSVDTSAAGPRRGAITFRGPTGEYRVIVEADVTAAPKSRLPDPAGNAEEEPRLQVQLPQPLPQPPEPPPVLNEAGRSGTVSVRPPEPQPARAQSPEPQPVRRPESQALEVQPSQSPRPPPQPYRPAPEPRSSSNAASASTVWALMPVYTCGFLGWVPVLHAAILLRKASLWWAALAYGVCLGVAVVLSVNEQTSAAGGLATIALVAASTTHAFSLRRQVFASQAPSVPTPRIQSRPMAQTVAAPKAARHTTAAPEPPPPGPATGEVPTVRVVALGVAGSGKTVLLSSMFHTLHVPMPEHSFYLETDARHRIDLSRLFAEVSDTGEPWPRGTRTGESREIAFDCYSFREGIKHRLLRISYLDYAGELLQSPDAGPTALADLEARIQSAHGLFAILDGYRILQYLRNQDAGRRYFSSSLQPLIGLMAGALCPIHFMITKWDLVSGFGEPAHADEATRLAMVREALLASPQIRALVDAHSYLNRVVRLFPVSAVGPDFAEVDAAGHVVKRQDGTMRPSNVELPLAVVLPDLFGHVDAHLGVPARMTLAHAAQERALLGVAEAEARLAALRSRPEMQELSHGLQVVLGIHGPTLAGAFLDWKAVTTGLRPVALGGPADWTATGARTRMVTEFCDAVGGLELRLPASRLTDRGLG
ncbi:MAG TPA: caspase family protein [Nocardioides sp.]|jgi:uncharacterized caspase-like protein